MYDFAHMDLTELLTLANAKRKALNYNEVEHCAIVSAKSGKCIEDCAYCAQSRFHSTNSPVHALMPVGEIVAAARSACNVGAQRFGIVTSGNAMTELELDTVGRAVAEIAATMPIKVCASLGALSVNQLTRLKSAGLSRYHHNIETAPSYYPKIVSTHTFQDRIRTINNAKTAGLEICCGGILGLGESWTQRKEYARTLNAIDPDSIPQNLLIAIAGTRLYDKVTKLSPEEALRGIALLRLLVDRSSIRLCGGREMILGPFQQQALQGGANGLLVGGYLTVKTHDHNVDNALIQQTEALWAA